MTTHLVDSHVHVFTSDLPVAGRAWTRPTVALPVEELVALMGCAGVTHAVVSAMSLLADPNRYTVEALQAHPDRLAPLLDGLCAAGTDVVVDHFGDPSPTDGYAGAGGQALLRALGTGRVRVKLSAAHRFPVAPELLARCAATLLRHAGPERLFLGTDAPFVGSRVTTSYAEQVAMFAQLVPDHDVRARMSAAAHAYYFGKGE
ncbi:amidohydrolase family protein [Pseudonocardia sp. CA-107938]|uniref:amidohydrolase family protein n=1 Tax=Pseudonocardia sp. CA-107938 TaxID=3240021 RepID=UPI003D8CA708